MNPWFIWNNKNSLSDFHLWINKLPKITRAKERYTTVDVPGRAGSLIMIEGEDVYDSYTREITVLTRNDNPYIQKALDWLRGEGTLVVCNEIDKSYSGRIVSEVQFDRLGNDLLQAKITFFVDPFKANRYPDKDAVTVTAASASIFNPGDVKSKPVVKIVGSGSNTITIGGKSMTFSSLSGTSSKPVVVDCDAHIITKDGGLWTNSVSGEFWKIPKGSSTITQTGSMTITIQPNWRWV